MLRILGCFSIEESKEEENFGTVNYLKSGSTSTNATGSIIASSKRCSVINLFVGSTAVDYVLARRTELPNSESKEGRSYNFKSTILNQDCRFFCFSQKCYRACWGLKHIESDFSVNCPFHLDGTVPTEQMKKFFLLTWTRQPSPSPVKWTRDIQDVGNNLPGSLRLSLPYMFFTANKNVRSLVSLLDTQIETFMRVRSKIHNCSSFK